MLKTASNKCMVDEMGQTVLAISARWGYFEITKMLLEAGLPVNDQNKVSAAANSLIIIGWTDSSVSCMLYWKLSNRLSVISTWC